jgi:putative transposase
MRVRIARTSFGYNIEHRHSGIGLMPPDIMQYGRATQLTAQRVVTLDVAFIAHPARFKGIAPRPSSVPLTAWINPPKKGNHTNDYQTQLLH